MSTYPGIELKVLVVELVSYMVKALAEFGDRRKELGLPISEEAILQMESNLVVLLQAIFSFLWLTCFALLNLLHLDEGEFKAAAEEEKKR